MKQHTSVSVSIFIVCSYVFSYSFRYTNNVIPCKGRFQHSQFLILQTNCRYIKPYLYPSRWMNLDSQSVQQNIQLHSRHLTLARRGLFARWSDISVATRVVSREPRASSGVAEIVYAVLLDSFLNPWIYFSSWNRICKHLLALNKVIVSSEIISIVKMFVTILGISFLLICLLFEVPFYFFV